MYVWYSLIIVGVIGIFTTPLSFAELQGDIIVGIPNMENKDIPDREAQILLAIQAGVLDFNRFLEGINASWRIVVNGSLGVIPDTNIILGSINNETFEHAQSNDVLAIGCCAAAINMAIPGDAIFQIYPDAIKQGNVLARILHAQGVNVVIPMYGAGAYGDVLWRAMADAFVTHGGAIDEGVRYTHTDDLSLKTERLAQRVQYNLDIYDSDANVAVLLISQDEGVRILESALSHDVLHMVPWFADEYMTKSSTLIQNDTVSNFLEDVNYTSIQVAETHNAQHDHIEETILEQYRVSPGSSIYTAYDAVWILGLSILQANTTNVASVSEILPDVAYNYTGITGDITLDVSGDMIPGDYTLWSIRDSKWERTSRYAHQTNEVIPTLPSTVVIPVIADITGDLSVMGREGLAGMALATDDFNMHQQEISADWRLELDIKDSETDTQRHLELIQDINGDIVLSCAASNSLAASLDYIHEQELVVVSSCSTSSELSIPDSLYRLYPDDGNIIDLFTEQLKNNHTIMIVRNDSWGVVQSLQLSKQLNNYTIIQYSPDTQNYTRIIHDTLDAVNKYGPQGIDILLLGFAESVDILSAAAEHDILYNVSWFGSNGNARYPDIVSDSRVSHFAELVEFTAPANADATIPARLQLDLSNMGTVSVTELAQTTLRLDRYVSDRVPVAYASGPVAYDSVWLIAMTLNNTRTLQPEIFQDAFVDMAASHIGVTGPTTLNEAGDLLLALYDVWSVQDGDWVFQSRYSDGTFLSIDDMRLQLMAMLIVDDAIANFDANYTVPFEGEETFLFIIDIPTGEIVTYDAHQNYVNMSYYDLINFQEINIGELIVGNATSSGSWMSHMWPNTNTGIDEFVTAWVKSHGDRVFGAGIYMP